MAKLLKVTLSSGEERYVTAITNGGLNIEVSRYPNKALDETSLQAAKGSLFGYLEFKVVEEKEDAK